MRATTLYKDKTCGLGQLPFVAVVAAALFLGGCAALGGNDQDSASLRLPDVAEEAASPSPRLDDDTAGRIFQHYLSASLAESRNDIAQAGQHYLRAMRADPENIYLQDRAFSLLLASGNYMGAVEVAKAISSAGENSQPLVQLLLTFDAAMTGKNAAALERLADMRQKAPDLIQFELIEQYIRLAQGEDIAKVTEKLKNFEVGAGMLVYKYYHLGRLHLRAGNRPEAIKAFRSGQLMDPSSLFVVTALGETLMAEGRYDDALQIYESFLDLNPDSLLIHAPLEKAIHKKPVTLETQETTDDLAEVMFGLASMMIGQEVNLTARQFLHLALMANSEHQLARFMLGLVEEQDGNLERALSSYKKINPGSAPYLSAQVRISEVLYKQGQKKAAISALEDLVNTNPDVHRLHQPLARLYHDEGNYQKAAEHYSQLIKTIDTPSRRHAPLYFARGAAYERMGSFEKAARDLETSLELEPSNPVVLNYLGYMWLDQGHNLENAYGYIRQAAQLRPHDGAIVDSLGWAYYKRGQFETAIHNLEKAVSLLPNDPVINMHLGQAYSKVGREQEARVKWQRALSLEPESQEDVKRLEELLGQ